MRRLAWVRRGGRGALLRGSDLALVYALVVAAVAVALHAAPDHLQVRFVQETSSNLVNLRRFPLRVLLLSALVVPDLAGLWILVPLVVALTAATRWLGRGPTLVALVFGHVGATLFVASLLLAGVTDGRLDPSVARAPDVGVSYALAGVCGMLAARVPRRWRWAYVLVPTLGLGAVLAAAPDFTAVGHLTALAIGLGLGAVAHRAATPAAGP
ncbi:hypothetical protein GTR02_00460 [Kineococcus sp. R8]|uniref:rhomboid-like protein n=1 Tax=Kineococcus siccus TaxID=2696567 RepID=UPI0014123A5D|nr:rhomboid-like protein [Kineococcus siccus]NAZ80293.1 hypothetical protein [Kineococcus siccus]